MGESSLLFEKVFNRKLSADTSLEYITHITQEYPYFSTAQFYLLFLSGKGTKEFEQQAAKTSIFFNNAWWLQFQLQEMQEQPVASSPVGEQQIPNPRQEDITIFQALEPVVTPTEGANSDFNEPYTTNFIADNELNLTVEETELLQPENFTTPFIDDIPEFPLPQAEIIDGGENHLEESSVATEMLPGYSQPSILPLLIEDHQLFQVPDNIPVSPVEENEHQSEDEGIATEMIPVYSDTLVLPLLNEEHQSIEVPDDKPVSSVEENEHQSEDAGIATEMIPVYSEPLVLPLTTGEDSSAPLENPVSTSGENKEEIVHYRPSQHAGNEIQLPVYEPDSAGEPSGEFNAATEIPVSTSVENKDEFKVNNQGEHFNNDTQPLVNEPDTDFEVASEAEIAPLNFKLNIDTGITTEDTITFEPLHTTDYFASLGIKLSGDVTPGDKLGKQLKSFTEWLKTMKKIHPDHLPVQSAAADISIQNLAEKSNKEDEVVTEAMAAVLLQQGKTQKAIEVFKKLSLLNPSKSAYFAAKIDQLNEH